MRQRHISILSNLGSCRMMLMRYRALKKYILVFLIAIPIMLLAWNMSDSAGESMDISDSTGKKIESSWVGVLQGTDEIISEEIEAVDEEREHVKVYSEIYPFREPEPWVEAISDTYFNAKVFGDKYIAYMDFDVISADEITLTLADMFNKGILHQEVVRDFTVCADPMSYPVCCAG